MLLKKLGVRPPYEQKGPDRCLVLVTLTFQVRRLPAPVARGGRRAPDEGGAGAYSLKFGEGKTLFRFKNPRCRYHAGGGRWKEVPRTWRHGTNSSSIGMLPAVGFGSAAKPAIDERKRLQSPGPV